MPTMFTEKHRGNNETSPPEYSISLKHTFSHRFVNQNLPLLSLA